MGQRTIHLPDIGEGVTQAEVVEWNVAPGQVVMEDQPLLSVMTDKASVELPSPVTGTVRSLAAAVGDMVAVGGALLVIETSGDDPPAAPPASERRPEPSNTASRPLASPAVRRRAREMGIDLARVRGSGPKQRVVHADLDAHGDAEVDIRAEENGAANRPVGPDAAATPSAAGEDIELVKLTGLRRRIAERMEIATREIPHITYVEEVDVTTLEALRAQLNVQSNAEPNAQYGAARGKLTVLPFVALAMVRAVAGFPRMNGHYDGREGVLRQHRGVHLGVATQTPAGLMVPVVRNAQNLDVWAMAGEIARLATAARDGSARRDELSGSTITLSSLGPLGGLVSTPVINHPEVAIVGVNRIRTAPVLQQGMFVPRQVMNLSSSFDHRIVDGWDAASFIQRIQSLLQHPATLFMD